MLRLKCIHKKFYLSLIIFYSIIPLTFSAWADDGICPASFSGFPNPADFVPAERDVLMTVLSANVSEDVDTDVLFFTDKADLFGKMYISEDVLSLPLIDGSDNPHWVTGNTFTQRVETDLPSVGFELWDEDGAASGDDDVIDLNTLSSSRKFEAGFDLCTLRINLADGTNVPSQGVIEARGDSSSGSENGVARLRIESLNGRPPTVEDVALIEVSPVQVIHRPRRLVAGKPMVLMARVANNFNREISTSISFDIVGPNFGFKETFPITPPLQAGEVRRLYFRRDVPIIVPAPKADDNILYINARIDPLRELQADLPADDCRRRNDFISEDTADSLRFKIVESRLPVIHWMKVGRLLTTASLATDAQIARISALGSAFIKATYPTPDVRSIILPFAYSPSLVGGLFDFVTTLLNALAIPADSAIPFVALFDLNFQAGLLNMDRIVGVVPRTYFSSFLYGFWDTTPGVSLTTVGPRAVLVSAEQLRRGDDHVSVNDYEPSMSLPSHELGHTFGLSVDPELKDSVFCGIDEPISTLICGIGGGYDEYKHEDVLRKPGNPSSGFWIKTGDEPAEIASLTDNEQCNTNCLMGSSPRADFLSWNTRKRWIDAADYEALIDALSPLPDPDSILLAGAIGYNDQVFLSPFYRVGERVPDRDDNDKQGIYRFRFLDRDHQELSNVGLAGSWSTSESAVDLPITFFVQVLPFPKGTKIIQLWNEASNKLLAQRVVSRNAPNVKFLGPKKIEKIVQGKVLKLEWNITDEDQKEDSKRKAKYWVSIHASSGKSPWAPVRSNLSGRNYYRLDTGHLEPGIYQFRLQASDGVNSDFSRIRTIEITEKVNSK